MNVIGLMMAVTACYTISSLSDKYAVSKAGFNGNEFTFIMCASMSVFLGISLPFQAAYVTAAWQSFVAIICIFACKFLEFQMSALILKELSAFELKAWLGLTLFISYTTDVIFGAEINILKILSICITVIGLVFIAASGGKREISYGKIVIPLILYLGAKYGYGLTIKTFSPYISPSLQLLFALLLISALMLFMVKPADLFRKNPKGTLTVIIARVPNTLGMILENAVIAISLADYSFIQPMILVSLFLISVIRKEKYRGCNLAGSIICIIGVIMFQAV